MDSRFTGRVSTGLMTVGRGGARSTGATGKGFTRSSFNVGTTGGSGGGVMGRTTGWVMGSRIW